MRTTLNLDEDVLDRAKALSRRLKSPFKRIVNEALRAGLKEVEAPCRSRPYRTEAHDMGLKAGVGIDNIQELLAHVEGEDRR